MQKLLVRHVLLFYIANIHITDTENVQRVRCYKRCTANVAEKHFPAKSLSAFNCSGLKTFRVQNIRFSNEAADIRAENIF